MEKYLKLIFAATTIICISACSALTAANQAQEQEMEELVDDAVNDRSLSIEVNYINPAHGPSRPSTDGYRITIRDGKANSYLPFFGVSRGSAGVYGIEPAGIEFKDYPVEIDDRGSKPEKGKYVYNFIAKSGNERVAVSITFWANGSAQISCNPENRSVMNYSGTLTRIPESGKE